MRDLARRIERLEAVERHRNIVCVWMGDRPADEVMLEHFGSTEAPPGVTVYLFRWAEAAPDEMLRPREPLRVEPDPAWGGSALH